MNDYFRKHTFDLVAWGCGLFVFLTLLAMLFYAGGHRFDHAYPGYLFNRNFFSDLGRTVAYSGRPNTISAALFMVALSMAGAGLVLFFMAYPRFFKHSLPLRLLSLAGSVLGVLAGASFIGVALTPADISRPFHTQFVMWAFRLFPLAVFFYIPALFLSRSIPPRNAWLFVLFWLLLTGYYLLITEGPGMDTPQGFIIQVVGQKIIAYTSVISIGLQSLGAQKLILKQHHEVRAVAN